MTIKDIARESGYAISTVSRALNNHPDVSRTAKAKIEQIVAQYGFEPNKNARQLKAVQSKSICLLVKGTFNTFFASIVERMQALICEAGFTAEVHYADEDANEVLIAKTICKEAKPMGIIFLGGNKQNFHDCFDGIDIPCVLSTTYFTDIENKFLSTVGVDDVTSAKMAVDYLIDNGHKKIGVLGSNPQTSYTSRKRLEGAIDSYKEKGDAAF
ncbi:MAG: LacI family DNA-binding transcriptional regulator, partial [Oscillospiraceae bacterium]